MKNFGLAQQPFDPRDYWLEEVLGSSDIQIPKSYRVTGLTYEAQYSYPYCVSFACTSLIEWKYKQEKDGGTYAFSQPHLFYHAGGSKVGSTFRGNLNVAKGEDKGLVPYGKFPMPDPRYTAPSDWYETTRVKALATPFDDATKITGYAKVYSWDIEATKRAILEHGPLMIGVYAGGKDYYSNPYHVRSTDHDNHCVLLAGWTEDGRWILFDSLGYVSAPKDWGGESLPPGYRTVSPDYKIKSAYAVIELPKDVKKKVEEVRSDGYDHALNHYGMTRNFEAEQRNAVDMLDAFKKFKNQSVLEAAGKFWTVLVNAVTYGGYNFEYTKWGRWYAGDVINSVYNWRRTGQHIFDFNKKHGEDGYRITI